VCSCVRALARSVPSFFISVARISSLFHMAGTMLTANIGRMQIALARCSRVITKITLESNGGSQMAAVTAARICSLFSSRAFSSFLPFALHFRTCVHVPFSSVYIYIYISMIYVYTFFQNICKYFYLIYTRVYLHYIPLCTFTWYTDTYKYRHMYVYTKIRIYT